MTLEQPVMFSIFSQPRVCRGSAIDRREWLRVGGIGLLGLSSSDLLRLRAQAEALGSSAPRAKSCVFIFLFGGPSHLDLWDMKPDAPAEIRGEFRPIDTAVPGIRVCEHLPMLARSMDKFCLLRSMTHRMPVHGPACSEMYSGRPYFGPPVTDQARPEDWPSLSAMLMRYGQARGGLPASVVLPWYTQFVGQGERIAGQTGGRMGERHNAFLIDGDPSRADFAVPGIGLPADVPVARVDGRRRLLDRLRGHSDDAIGETGGAKIFEKNAGVAFSMLGRRDAAEAFEIRKESPRTLQRYGSGKFARSLLLARRLIEAGVSLVTVNWDDDSGADKVSPYWDTHHDAFPKLKERLAPVFDRAYSAFLEDLAQRGLLESTLVVTAGEFGRTPKIGQFTQNAMTEKTGRDHWPHAFTALLAGGGVRGGQVHGATNSTGGYVADKPVTPADLAATMLEHLGVDASIRYRNLLLDIDHELSVGSPVGALG